MFSTTDRSERGEKAETLPMGHPEHGAAPHGEGRMHDRVHPGDVGFPLGSSAKGTAPCS